MALVTVVRSLVGTVLDMPDGRKMRPWHVVEVRGNLSPEWAIWLSERVREQQVQFGQVHDGLPVDSPSLDRKE